PASGRGGASLTSALSDSEHAIPRADRFVSRELDYLRNSASIEAFPGSNWTCDRDVRKGVPCRPMSPRMTGALHQSLQAGRCPTIVVRKGHWTAEQIKVSSLPAVPGLPARKLPRVSLGFSSRS